MPAHSTGYGSGRIQVTEGGGGKLERVETGQAVSTTTTAYHKMQLLDYRKKSKGVRLQWGNSGLNKE